MSVTQDDDKNQDDIDALLASMDGDVTEDASSQEMDETASDVEEQVSQEDVSSKNKQTEDSKPQKKQKNNLKDKVINALSGFAFLKKGNQPNLLKPAYLKNALFFAIGSITALLVFIIAYLFLDYLAPETLKPSNVQLSTTVITVAERPTINKENKQNVDAEKEALLVLPQKGQASIPLKKDAQDNLGDKAPYSFYQRNSSQTISPTAPVIAIMLNDVGLSKSRLDKIIETLPVGTSIAFSPYSTTLPNLNETIETWMTLPTEKSNIAHDPGVLGLYNSRDLTLNMNALVSLLNKHSAFTGFVIPPYSSFPKEKDQYKKIIEKIYMMGYGVLDSSFLSIPPLTMTLGKTDFPYLEADIIIDQKLSSEDITANFKKLETIALENKQAIAMIHPYPLTLKLYQEWSSSLNEKNIYIVPLSDLFKRP